MSKSTPSLMALLGLVAFAGYQNRARIADMLADARQNRAGADGTTPEQGGFLAEIGQIFQPGPSGVATAGTGFSSTGLSSALRDLKDRFTATGQGEAAESWISTEANRPLNVEALEAALGPETLDDLARKTGISRAELLLRLNVALPEVVDSMTPEGRLPTDGGTQFNL
ncbi:MAG: YidB family protein [Fuscovulum sp.]|nr:MAG: YidB family protein [Fuscovulum sp.]